MHGVFNLLKPPGMTSHDAVSVARRILGTKRIGHTGTLDPAAAGVLPLCVGQATRLVEYLQDGTKEYIAEATFGHETDTGDAVGQVVARGDASLVDLEKLRAGLQAAMADSPVEEVRVLFLNAKNMLLANEAMWRGSVDEAAVHVREVISRAISLGATAIIIVHNHPSGDPSPSQQDIRLTRDLIEAGRHMRVTVHDHVIVGSQGRSSMKALGLI